GAPGRRLRCGGRSTSRPESQASASVWWALRAGPADRAVPVARRVLLRARQPRVGAAAAGAPALGAADPRLARAPRDLAAGESRGACHAHGQRAGGVADAELAVAAAAAAGNRGLRELD